TAVVGRRNLCCQNFGRDECRYLAVSGGIDPIVDEWRSQNNLAARIAYRRSKRSPVPCQHRRRRKERLGIGWILTDNRSLITTKEKQLVLCNRSANRPTKLVALQRTVPCGKVLPRIGEIVAYEFEQIAVQFVRSGLCDRTHSGARTVRCSQTAGLDLEFLSSIGK